MGTEERAHEAAEARIRNEAEARAQADHIKAELHAQQQQNKQAEVHANELNRKLIDLQKAKEVGEKAATDLREAQRVQKDLEQKATRLREQTEEALRAGELSDEQRALSEEEAKLLHEKMVLGD